MYSLCSQKLRLTKITARPANTALKKKEGKVVTKYVEVLNSWVGYIRHLFHEKQKTVRQEDDNLTGNVILKSATEAALKEMKNQKSPTL